MNIKNKIKEIELSTIRHNLRTPVNHIIGYSELLIEEADECLGDDLKRIHSGGRELLSLINDFFDETTFDLNKVREDSTLLKLRTPVTQIIGYSELLLEEAADSGKEEILTDLNRVHNAASEWLRIMESSLFTLAKGELKIKTDNDTLKPALLPVAKLSKLSELKGKLLIITKDIKCTSELLDVARIAGHSIESVKTINAALEWLKSNSVDLILLTASPVDEASDLFINHLSNNVRLRAIPVIIVAQLGQIDFATKSIKEGIDGFLSVPFDREQTLRLINRQLTEKFLRDRTTSLTGRILVVDDDENNRDVLTKRLQRFGHQVTTIESAEKAIELLYQEEFDVILLDMIMPGMNGDEALAQIKYNRRLQKLPVIMISGLDQMDGIVRCIEIGAEDYLPKPFDSILLKARINAALEKKQLRHQEAIHLEEIQVEKARSENLLLNILPAPIATRLKSGEQVIADNFQSVSVLFSDLVGFTTFSNQTDPKDLVIILNRIFTEFDEAAEKLGMEKIKTIGDAYMAAAGLPKPKDDHAQSAVLLGKEMLKCLAKLHDECHLKLEMRVGIHSGPVTAGVIGKKKFIYDLWGDTVNIASRMESQGEPGRIQITAETAKLLNEAFPLEERGQLNVKGRGLMTTFLISV
ncbi:MAG: response regulator [Opitutae bacterium]|jgi:adenylate cyclase|nr:response regulator [Opitutae bacterium]